jgi:hypothetical protein
MRLPVRTRITDYFRSAHLSNRSFPLARHIALLAEGCESRQGRTRKYPMPDCE